VRSCHRNKRGTAPAGTAVVIEIPKQRRHGSGHRVAASEESEERLRNGKRLVAVVVVTDRSVAVRLLHANQREDHLAGDLVALASRVRG
jgi:hypothetical protein